MWNEDHTHPASSEGSCEDQRRNFLLREEFSVSMTAPHFCACLVKITCFYCLAVLCLSPAGQSIHICSSRRTSLFCGHAHSLLSRNLKEQCVMPNAENNPQMRRESEGRLGTGDREKHPIQHRSHASPALRRTSPSHSLSQNSNTSGCCKDPEALLMIYK
jgi:hypothetical protein